MTTFDEVRQLMQEDEFDGLSTLIQLGDDAVPHLQAILGDPSQPDRMQQRALVVLGEMGTPTAVADVQPFLTDDSPVLRYMAANALASMQGAAATPALLALLQDDDYSVVKTAVHCLSQVGDETALTALALVQTGNPHEPLRDAAAQAAARIEERTG